MVIVRRFGFDTDYEYNYLEQVIIRKIDELYGLGYVYSNPDHLLTLNFEKDTLVFGVDTNDKWFKQVIKIKGVQSKQELKTILVRLFYPYIELATVLESSFRLKFKFNSAVGDEDVKSFLENKPQVRIGGVINLQNKAFSIKIAYNNKELLVFKGVASRGFVEVNDELLNRQRKVRRVTIFWLVIAPLVKLVFNVLGINGEVVCNNLFSVYKMRYYLGEEEGFGKLWKFNKGDSKTLFLFLIEK